MKGLAACLSIVHFSYFPTFQTELCRKQSSFLRLELSRGTTIAAEISQAVIDLKLEVK